MLPPSALLRPSEGRSFDALRLYPPLEPYDSGYMEVGDGHSIYWETCGNPQGQPVLFLHGGPGGGCSPFNRRFFNPQRYRIILFDQRGCGRSLPHASLDANTTPDLLHDIEQLRERLAVDRWLLFGGSWGATLALAYAQAFPHRVAAMVLRGVFAARKKEICWLYREGASLLFPDAWAEFTAPLTAPERDDPLSAYYRRLTSGDPCMEAAAARSWCEWEERLTTLRTCPPGASDAAALRALARIETHYFMHRAFLEEGQLIRAAAALRGIPGVIIQGRYDMVAPPVTAWELAQAWGDAELHIVDGAGHASSEPGVMERLIAATDRFSGAGLHFS